MVVPLALSIAVKEWTMSSVRPSNSGCTGIVGRAQRQTLHCAPLSHCPARIDFQCEAGFLQLLLPFTASSAEVQNNVKPDIS